MTRAAPTLRIGVTGSVAAGKSAVGRLFERWGAWRIDADELAREAVRPGSPTLREIRARWGDAVLAPDGSLDRGAMRGIAFEDEAERRALERLVHAGVRELRGERRRAAAAAGARVVVEEVPLLFEVGLEDEYDAIVVVDAPVALRKERARRARGWSDEEFAAIEASQMPVAEKRAAADHVIENASDLEALARAARLVWDRVAAVAKRPRPDPRAVDGGRGPA